MEVYLDFGLEDFSTKVAKSSPEAWLDCTECMKGLNPCKDVLEWNTPLYLEIFQINGTSPLHEILFSLITLILLSPPPHNQMYLCEIIFQT